METESKEELFGVKWKLTDSTPHKSKRKKQQMSIDSKLADLLTCVQSEKMRLQTFADKECFWDMFNSFETIEKMVKEMVDGQEEKQ